jgi:uncharacterized Zn-finger protein
MDANIECSRIISCKVCGQMGKSTSITNHMKLKHGAGELLRCELCPYITTMKQHLKRHYVTCMQVKVFSCEECWNSFETQIILKNHRRVHAPKIVCDECDKEFRKKDALANHVKKNHIEKEDVEKLVYACKQCKKTFGRKDTLMKHMKFFTILIIISYNMKGLAFGILMEMFMSKDK